MFRSPSCPAFSRWPAVLHEDGWDIPVLAGGNPSVFTSFGRRTMTANDLIGLFRKMHRILDAFEALRDRKRNFMSTHRSGAAGARTRAGKIISMRRKISVKPENCEWMKKCDMCANGIEKFDNSGSIGKHFRTLRDYSFRRWLSPVAGNFPRRAGGRRGSVGVETSR